MPPRRPTVALLTALAMVTVLAGCGDDDTPETTPPTVDDADPDAEEDGETALEDEDTEETRESLSDTPEPSETTAPDAVAEDPPGDTGGEHEGMGDAPVFLADLSGQEGLPGPGHPTATGRIELESSMDGNVCIDLRADGLVSDIIDAHIHEAGPGGRGEVVIPIGTPTSTDGEVDVWRDVCVPVDAALEDRMVSDPGRFHADIHTVALDAGAIGGQLQAATIFDLSLT